MIRRDMMHFGVNGSITEPGFFKTQVTDLSLTEDDLKKWWSNLPTEVRRAYGDSYLHDYINLQEFSMKILASSDLSKVTSCMPHAMLYATIFTQPSILKNNSAALQKKKKA
ncbi:11-cis retinol dehydrogenase-like [Sinocyclocheilus grahami]|uniref:11-cis retinol dehydrogenase-like n=1 Tax=Sinocyclocheilus grahami TaxID=75366 RepID=UPI0007AD1CF0|nr:PREDICTED: 11-cis retinol dehydrogenase-like [Sinocyclocheilus grahami]